MFKKKFLPNQSMKGKIRHRPPQEGKEGERERKGLYFFEPNLNLLRKFHNNQDLCKYCQYMRTCLKNYSYSYIYIFGNFPSRPRHMLYLPLGFWGLQVNLQTQEQKSVHTREMSEDTPKAALQRLTPATATVAHCRQTAAAKASPGPAFAAVALWRLSDRLAQGTDNMPGLRPHPRANSASTLRRCWDAILTPVGFSGSPPQVHSELRTTATPDLLLPCRAHHAPTSQSEYKI